VECNSLKTLPLNGTLDVGPSYKILNCKSSHVLGLGLESQVLGLRLDLGGRVLTSLVHITDDTRQDCAVLSVSAVLNLGIRPVA